MNIINPYRPLIEEKNQIFILSGGRTSGKSNVIAQLLLYCLLSKPDRDIIVARDTQASLSSSVYAEIESLIHIEGYADLFIFRKSPQQIIRKGGHGTVHFLGIGGADLSRTRSYKTKKPVSAIIFEELQQVRTLANYEQAMASFRRLLDPEDWRVVLAYNPPPQASHWVNVFTLLHEGVEGYQRIHTTYKSVWRFLNSLDRREIILKKSQDPEGFKNMFLGIPCGGLGAVYPMFNREKLLLNSAEADSLLLKNGTNPIRGIIIGGDGAVTRDCTAFVPIAIFADNRALVLDIFYHDPKESGVLGSSQLMAYVRLWFDELCRKYSLKDPLMPIPIAFTIDSAATDLVHQTAYEFGSEALVSAVHKKTIAQMVAVVQSALCRNAVYLLDTGAPVNYVDQRASQVHGNVLAEQLESLVWKVQPNGVANMTYDPLIPNDVADAFTYAIFTFFENPANLPFAVGPSRLNSYEPVKPEPQEEDQL